MTEEKQIEEIEELDEILRKACSATPNEKCIKKLCSKCRAETVIEAGYRKQSVGEWKEKAVKLTWCEDDVDIVYECSCCATTSHGESPYCPNCGAKMKGGAE